MICFVEVITNNSLIAARFYKSNTEVVLHRDADTHRQTLDAKAD